MAEGPSEADVVLLGRLDLEEGLLDDEREEVSAGMVEAGPSVD